jgi:hypothetical protein
LIDVHADLKMVITDLVLPGSASGIDIAQRTRAAGLGIRVRAILDEPSAL